MTVQRDAKGRLLPGSNNNPSGRPKGFRGVAEYIREQSNDFRELIDFAFKVFRNDDGLYTTQQQIDAKDWLADRGLGRAVQQIELDASMTTQNVTIEGSIDITRLSVDQLANLESLLTAATLTEATATPLLHGDVSPVTRIINHPGSNESRGIIETTGTELPVTEAKSAG